LLQQRGIDCKVVWSPALHCRPMWM